MNNKQIFIRLDEVLTRNGLTPTTKAYIQLLLSEMQANTKLSEFLEAFDGMTHRVQRMLDDIRFDKQRHSGVLVEGRVMDLGNNYAEWEVSNGNCDRLLSDELRQLDGKKVRVTIEEIEDEREEE